MKKKTIRTGIIGACFSVTFHFDCLKKVHGANVEVDGIYALDTEQALSYAKQRQIHAYDSLEELIDKVDVVHVCTPPVAHEPIAVAALKRDKFSIVEKPLTGYFGPPDGQDDFSGDTFAKTDALEGAPASIERMLKAKAKSKGRILYAENWVYAPSIQKEREIIEKTGAQILWIHGEEAHSGSQASTYGFWKFSGGGAMIDKGCHPLTAALYLKRYVVEKTGTKQGWSNPSPDEDWFTGYPQEVEAFYRTIAYDEPLESDSILAADTVSTIYSAYVSAEKKGAEVTIKTFSARFV